MDQFDYSYLFMIVVCYQCDLYLIEMFIYEVVRSSYELLNSANAMNPGTPCAVVISRHAGRSKRPGFTSCCRSAI